MPRFGEVAPESPGYRRFCRIRTGTYTGDGGVAQAITGIGFQPKYLIIIQSFGASMNQRMDYTTDQHGAGLSDYQTAAVYKGNEPNHIDSLDPDGFTVNDGGTDAPPNKLGDVYIFIAFG